MSDTVDSPAERLAGRLESQQALVGVIGLGYVGLPLALTFSEVGFPVLGFDVDRDKIRILREGGCYVGHLDADRVAGAIDSGRLQATSDFDRLAEPDVLIVCVPTPLAEDRTPDLQFIAATVDAIATKMREGQLIVLESTTYPGTCDEVVRPALSRGDRRLGREFFLAYSPEREDPGNPNFSTKTIPKVVGGLDKLSGDLAESLYSHIVPEVVRVSSAGVAEATKLTENIFRAVNIALVNELKMVFDKLGIDIWEVLDAAETKPFGFMRFNPGPGWGGHCIPIDPFYLSWKASQCGAEAKFIELAGTVNREIPKYVIDKLCRELATRGTDLQDASVLLVGLSYKKNIGDTRQSPALVLMDSLRRLGARVSYHDPFVALVPSTRSWPELSGTPSTPLSPVAIEAFDAVVIVTDHDVIDWSLILESARLVLDTRGVFRDAQPNLVSA